MIPEPMSEGPLLEHQTKETNAKPCIIFQWNHQVWKKCMFISQNKQSSTQSDLDLLIVFVAKNLISKQRCQHIARIPRAEIPPFTPVGREARWWNFEGAVYKNAI